MKKIFMILGIATAVVACDNVQVKTADSVEEAEAMVAEESDAEKEAEANMEPIADDVTTGVFGAEISTEGAMTVAELREKIGDADSINNVVITGSVVQSCRKMGCWMTIQDDEKDLMVKFRDYGFFVPKKADGNVAVFAGTAYNTTVPVDELRHYAEDAGKSKEEIEAITEPETKITFVADGVEITAPEAVEETQG